MKKMIAKKHTKNRRGTAVVEMALVFPIFMLLVLGIVEFGRFLMVGQLLTNAAREGARMAISDQFTEAEIQADIEATLLNGGGIAANDLVIAITTETGNTLANSDTKDLVTVSIAVRFRDVSYLSMFDSGGGANDPFTGLRDAHDASNWIRSASSMRME